MEFIELETLQEKQDFINALAEPLGNATYAFSQTTLAGMQQHIDAEIATTVEKQVQMRLPVPVWYVREMIQTDQVYNENGPIVMTEQPEAWQEYRTVHFARNTFWGEQNYKIGI